MSQTVLLVTDDPAVAETVRLGMEGSAAALLKPADNHRYRLEWIRSGKDALVRIAAEDLMPIAAAVPPGATVAAHTAAPAAAGRPPSVAAILVDLCLPDGRGLDIFKQLFRVAPHLPIMVLCSPENEDQARTAMQLGAQDYLLTTRIDSYVLPKALRGMTERADMAEALFEEKERAQVTLNSIGDAVIATDQDSRVKYLNAVAERMTGWPLAEALGRPVEEVLRIMDASTRKAVPNPMIEAVRENRTIRLTPNCLLVERHGGEVAIEDSAAPIHNHRGRPSGAVMVFHDVSLARALSLKMSHLAQHDPLTDLPNRALLDDRLTQAIAMAHRNGKKLALLFVDMDHFKAINDALGHGVGDQVLKSVARRLLACVRSPDSVSRQGGDEFVILLAELSHSQDAAVIAEKIRTALAPPHRIDHHTLPLTASIGIATYPEDGATGEDLMRNADFAMYHAKESGRNAYQFYKAEMGEGIVERRAIESGLRHAVERHELDMHYQPLVNLETGFIVGVEALLRWRREDREAVPTSLFVRVAEQCGLIVPIGRWVLNHACRQAKAWLDAGLMLPRISVNVSEVELRARDFVESVSNILAASGLPANLLELELTETFLVRDLPSTAVVFAALKAIGVHLALDDFGTGYSSLSHLRGLPIDTLKIDQSFVRDLTTEPGVARIVSAVISLGASLGMQVIAEGVETVEQQAFLVEHGCPVGQGFLYGRPMPAAAITTMLALQMGEVKRSNCTALVVRAKP